MKNNFLSYIALILSSCALLNINSSAITLAEDNIVREVRTDNDTDSDFDSVTGKVLPNTDDEDASIPNENQDKQNESSVEEKKADEDKKEDVKSKKKGKCNKKGKKKSQ